MLSEQLDESTRAFLHRVFVLEVSDTTYLSSRSEPRRLKLIPTDTVDDDNRSDDYVD